MRPRLQTTVAVAPALNFSGQTAVDPVAVADLMASEMAQLPGIGVIGVNRVLAILADQGVDRIQSPEHALRVCERLGSDGIVVFAVTEYDPYTPVVGMAAQLYGRSGRMSYPQAAGGAEASRPLPVNEGRGARYPWAQTQRRFHGEQQAIREAVKEYARTRQAGGSPYGWEKYLVSQTWFLRFCCHEVALDLLEPLTGGPLESPETAVAGTPREID